MRRERARVGGTKGIVDYDWAPDGKSDPRADRRRPLSGEARRQRPPADQHARNRDRRASSPKAGASSASCATRICSRIDLASGAEKQLTRDGGGTVTCGTAEFVAQEEMDRSTGHWWAPGDQRLAVECFDEAKVKTVTRAAIGADGTKTYDQRYPAAGTPNVAVSLWVMAADGSGRVKVDLGGDPDIYLARVDWSQDGKTLLVQRESRDQKTLDVLAVDPATGAAKTLFTETSKTWINLTDDLKPVEGRQPDLGLGAHGLHAPLSLRRRAVDAADPWRLVGQQDLVGVDEASGRALLHRQQGRCAGKPCLCARLSRIGGEPRRVTERGLLERRGDGQGGDAPARHALQPGPAAAGLSGRRDRQAGGVDRGKPARRQPSLLRPISPRTGR